MLLTAALVFAGGLQVYLWYQSLAHKPLASVKLSKADDCEENPEAAAAAVHKENPNKLLFISCGGFEE